MFGLGEKSSQICNGKYITEEVIGGELVYFFLVLKLLKFWTIYFLQECVATMMNPSINLFNLLYPCPSALPISILCILQFCQHPYFLPPPPMMTAHMNAFNALYGAGRTMTPPNYNASPAFHASMPHPNHAHLYAGPMPSQVSSRNRISV